MRTGFDKDDGNGEIGGYGQNGGNHRRPQLVGTEGQRTERQSDETGVGIGSGCGVDGGIGQIFRFQPVKGEHPEKDDENPQFERVEEFGLVQLGP